MKKTTIVYLLTIIYYCGFAQFAPPVGQTGTTAIHKDSSVFVAWASGCSVTRGYQDISNVSLGYASAGDSSMALGKAGTNAVVSLGDGGSAILSFNNPVRNGIGYDFAVFENSFDDSFLELAFVEVSSDGINYYRFPATSNTQDTLQTGSFGSTDATKINNLAGKYKALYGTPFDLQELSGQSGLNVDSVTHIKIIDVTGCIQSAYATYDQNGNKINDPWSTPFASGGFDLDAVGIIHQAANGIDDFTIVSQCSVFPNPVNNNSIFQYYLNKPSVIKIRIVDLFGKEINILFNDTQRQGWQAIPLNHINLSPGVCFIHLLSTEGQTTKKIIVQ